MTDTLTVKKLKELFPKYIKEIEESHRRSADGCSRCTLMILRQRNPKEKFELPETSFGWLCV